MATNSHLAIEVRGLGGRTGWRMWAKDVAESGWYRMYDAMAEGRGTTEVDPVVPPRGIPEDADGSTRDYLEGVGGHHETWLTAGEYWQALSVAHHAQMTSTPGWILGEHDEWFVLGRVLVSLRELFGDEHVRLVMAFDN